MYVFGVHDVFEPKYVKFVEYMHVCINNRHAYIQAYIDEHLLNCIHVRIHIVIAYMYVCVYTLTWIWHIYKKNFLPVVYVHTYV